MDQNAAADHEHGDGAHQGKQVHQTGRRHQQPLPHRPAHGAAIGLLQQVQTDVVELDDEPHQAIDPDGHQQGDARHHGDLQAQARPLHGAEGDDDDLRREDEIGANGPFTFWRS